MDAMTMELHVCVTTRNARRCLMDSRRILTLAGCVISATAPLTGCGGGDGATDSGGTRDAPALDAPQGDAWQDLDAARRASVWSCLPLFDFPAP